MSLICDSRRYTQFFGCSGQTARKLIHEAILGEQLPVGIQFGRMSVGVCADHAKMVLNLSRISKMGNLH